MSIRVAVLQTKVSLLDLMTETGRRALGVSFGDMSSRFLAADSLAVERGTSVNKRGSILL